MKGHELYAAVTAQVIKHLEEGVPPWTRPWADHKRKGVGMIPSNLVSGRLYSGSNILLLWMTASAMGYDCLQYCTYQQARSIGANVRKGEKSTYILFTKPVINKEDDEERRGMIVKGYPVFHVSQLENVPERFTGEQVEDDRLPIHEEAIAVICRSGVPVKHGGNRAAYSRLHDQIMMPNFSAFHDEVDYWTTAMHELTHATGHKSRLDREFGARFGDQKYAFEELVAELGSAFICSRLRIEAKFRSASYIEGWLEILRGDTRAIFTAASAAGHAAEWLWNRAFPVEHQQAAE